MLFYTSSYYPTLHLYVLSISTALLTIFFSISVRRVSFVSSFSTFRIFWFIHGKSRTFGCNKYITYVNLVLSFLSYFFVCVKNYGIFTRWITHFTWYFSKLLFTACICIYTVAKVNTYKTHLVELNFCFARWFFLFRLIWQNLPRGATVFYNVLQAISGPPL